VTPLLEIRGLCTQFRTEAGWVHAVDGVDLAVAPGETVCLVGESGCGKTVTAMSVLRLLPMPPARIAAGQVLWEGRDLLALDARALNAIRGREIGMVFQEPMSSLNPVYTVGEQVAEAARCHLGLGRRAALAHAVDMLGLVQIPHPAQRVREYPHQFSGGMRQRVMIAIALACSPRLLIADEPTTALDVTIQAQVLDLLDELKRRLGMALLLITHAMGVVAQVAQRVAVMYAGRVVEEAPVDELFADPRHPYTRGLIRCIPRPEPGQRVHRLANIPGTVPRLLAPPQGCRFAPRCDRAIAACREAVPALREVAPGHKVACILEQVR
jgi:peptide/nickel transport system ATP-binding protein